MCSFRIWKPFHFLSYTLHTSSVAPSFFLFQCSWNNLKHMLPMPSGVRRDARRHGRTCCYQLPPPLSHLPSLLPSAPLRILRGCRLRLARWDGVRISQTTVPQQIAKSHLDIFTSFHTFFALFSTHTETHDHATMVPASTSPSIHPFPNTPDP